MLLSVAAVAALASAIVASVTPFSSAAAYWEERSWAVLCGSESATPDQELTNEPTWIIDPVTSAVAAATDAVTAAASDAVTAAASDAVTAAHIGALPINVVAVAPAARSAQSCVAAAVSHNLPLLPLLLFLLLLLLLQIDGTTNFVHGFPFTCGKC